MFAFILGGWLGLSIIVGVCAGKKGLNGIDYFFLSLFLSPVIGSAIVTLRKTRAYSWPTEAAKAYDRVAEGEARYLS